MSSIRAIFAALRTRPAVVALLVYQVFFLNVFLPGHTRGVITTEHRAAPSCDSCCASKPAKKSDAPANPTPRDRANCAVCHFAMRMTPAPAVDFKLPELGLLALLPIPPPQVIESLPFVPTYLGRGPPLSV